MATKSANVTARVQPEIKRQAEAVLERIGLPVSVLIDTLYRQIIKLTTQAIEQIQEIVRYISHILLVPETARKWADTLQSEIAKLDFMPTRYPLTEEEPWHTKGIHKMTFKNFLVYYLIDEKKEVVWVTAVVYGRRDQIIALVYMSLSDTE